MACDLPGIEVSWHAEPLKTAGKDAYEFLLFGWHAHLNEQGERLPDVETRSGSLLVPVRDEPPQVSERVLRDAIYKWTAVVPGQKTSSAKTEREPVSAGAGQ